MALNIDEQINAILNLRNRHFFALDILALVCLPALALTLRLDKLDWWADNGPALVLFTLVGLGVKIPTFYRLGLYRRYWRYTSVNDLALVMIAVSLSTALLTALFVGAHTTLAGYDLAMYRTVPLIDGMLTGLAVGGFRFGLRGLYHWYRQGRDVAGAQRVLVVGAGEAGTMVVREMRANPQLGLEPVAFADDDPAKADTYVHGLPVMGTCAEIPELVELFRIQRVVVAMPSAPLGRLQEMLAICKRTGVTTHNLPGIYQLLAGHKTLSRTPRVDIPRLLRREVIELDQRDVADYLVGAKVLVTGAGGSIGSELCRQIARFGPAEIVLLGHGEGSIFEIGLDLRVKFPELVTRQVIVDVRDERRVDWVVEQHRPDVIFHAAAHKHVPFMEESVGEAITNNVWGTRNVLRAAEKYGVGRFVLISTDKAVNPSSVMGATKRLGELLMLATGGPGHAYMAVRFGNVLGSRGSVVPIFQRQIAAGGPVTVTHPDMTRYFMTIPEAVQLVLQASRMGQGGEIFVLDMDEPVRILDLASDLIEMSGLERGRDIEIVYTGIRPGEKLNEELFLESEDYERTRHPKIFVTRPESALGAGDLEPLVRELVELPRRIGAQNGDERLRQLLLKICHYIDDGRPRPRPALPKPRVAQEAVPAQRAMPVGEVGFAPLQSA